MLIQFERNAGTIQVYFNVVYINASTTTRGIQIDAISHVTSLFELEDFFIQSFA